MKRYFLEGGKIVARSQIIYKITVNNWAKHNPKNRPNHPSFMLSKRFLDDAKVQTLSPTGVLLLLSCFILRSESSESHFEVNSKSLSSHSRVKSESLSSQLDQLQYLRLLTYEKIDLFINRIEKNRKEEKRREEKGRGDPGPKGPASDPATPPTEQVDLLPTESAPPTAHPFFLLWNEKRANLPAVKSYSVGRIKKAKLRWVEQTPEEWGATIQRMAVSDFCNGKNDRGWISGIDFLLKPETWPKVNEGLYDNKRGTTSTNQTRKYDRMDEIETKWKNKGVTE